MSYLFCIKATVTRESRSITSKQILTLKHVGMHYVIWLCLVTVAEFGCAVGARSQCPSHYSCSTTEANCTNVFLTEFPSCMLGRRLLKVDFSNNNITSVGEYTIRMWMIVSLKHLNISNNAIRTLSDKSFIGQSGLKVVDLSGNELEYISEKTFMYIPNLVWLSLANNKKLKIPGNTPFLKNTNLRVLHLENCGLYRISLIICRSYQPLQIIFVI
jgi:hypothetical protein